MACGRTQGENTRETTQQWTCKERGLEYPNAAVAKEIQHSTYLNVRSYFSLISHIDRVWEERGYDGCVVLGNMIGALMSKFGADLAIYEIDEPIEYRYGARKASEPMASQGTSAQTWRVTGVLPQSVGSCRSRNQCEVTYSTCTHRKLLRTRTAVDLTTKTE